MPSVITKCEYCGKEFMGSGSSKYCGEVCKGLAALERKTGFRVEAGSFCKGDCCPEARKHLTKKRSEWIIALKRDYMVKVGPAIKYCPFCGGELIV